ncbi:uncharacterized protein LOC112463035 [Temnothorax curvispinosus]|uniref:Uncharacterized protein LOC112463035 n=1 Tax=Temnothorax curvispinosus TaxID=300111 RepID=A0A6J1QWE7_9HYME|nr:uncharacterized protein LOC112463035 [Temnothorax curvispinosus]
MLGNVAKNSLLLRGKSVLLKRYNAPQVAYSVRSKWDTVSSKYQSTALESEDDGADRPIKYSTSKAATMRIDEYRDPIGDKYPWYQGMVISTSIAVFLVYFCILREENDIDMLLDTDLGESLSKMQKELEEKQNVKVKLK